MLLLQEASVSWTFNNHYICPSCEALCVTLQTYLGLGKGQSRSVAVLSYARDACNAASAAGSYQLRSRIKQMEEDWGKAKARVHMLILHQKCVQILLLQGATTVAFSHQTDGRGEGAAAGESGKGSSTSSR